MRYQTALGVIALLLVTTGCDQLDIPAPVSESTADVEAPAPTAPNLIAEVKFRGTLVYGGGLDAVRIPPALQSELTPEGNLVVSGSLVEPVSAGATGGVSFPLSEEFEAQVSGEMVNIHIVTSADMDGEAFLAYSTNEVGNSGWMAFPVSAGESVATLQYNVPAMQEGKGDFIGIDPNGHSLTIKAIVVEVVSED